MGAGAERGRGPAPADVAVVWPSDGEIVRAVFAAAASEGVDPIDVLTARASAAASGYALIALAEAYPTAPRKTLARKCGDDRVASALRARLVAGKPFDLQRLNAVRDACGWPAMTREQARDALLLYNGRPFTDFLAPTREPSRAPVAAAPAATGAIAPEAGSGREVEPATVSVAEDVSSWRPPAADRSAAVSAAAATTSDAGPGGEQSPATDFDGDAEAAARMACVERRKAWLRGDPPEVAETVAPKPAPFPLHAEAEEVLGDDLPSAPPYRAPPAPAPSLAPRKLSARARVVDHRPRGGDITAAFCGDPPPGRSALAQRGQP